jgi:hypothetical protein
MPAPALAVHIDVQGVGDLQTGSTGAGNAQIQLIAPVVGLLWGIRRKGLPTQCTALRSVCLVGGYRRFNASTMPGRSLGLARFAPGLFHRLAPFSLHSLGVLLIGWWILRLPLSLSFSIDRSRLHIRLLVLAWLVPTCHLPRGTTARRTRAVVRGLVEPITRLFQVSQQLQR